MADTSWIAALRDPLDAHHQAAVAVEHIIGSEDVLVATVTLAECLVAPAKLDCLEEAEAALRSAFDIDTVDHTAPGRWASRRAMTGLCLPDAIVLETALYSRARAVATFDQRLADACRAAGIAILGHARSHET